MRLPVSPPVAPMLAKAVKEIPDGPYSYEPKWDGFRSIIFRDGDEVEIGSRNERPMTRYFPELVTEVIEQLPERCVIDGEIVIPDGEGARLDFEALLQRIHPAASRVNLLATRPPPTSWRSTCSRWGTPTTPSGRSASAGPRWKTLSQRSAPRCTSPRPPPTGSWPGGGSPSSRAPGWTA